MKRTIISTLLLLAFSITTSAEEQILPMEESSLSGMQDISPVSWWVQHKLIGKPRLLHA